jgi:tRNA(Ile)-lysidine synthase
MTDAPLLTAPDRELEQIDAAARALVKGAGPIVLAVSGGRDSMVLLHAVHQALERKRSRRGSSHPVTVATFDHGTGAAATAAVSLVVEHATRLGFPVSTGRASRPGTTEAEWRAARWAFLRSVTPTHGTVATAHTRDDHIETVTMRLLRDAGARGLSGLATPTASLARPLLIASRAAVARYAEVHGVPFLDDPSNQSRRHLRNRVRLDLLPAVRAVRPRFEAEMADLADRAAALRAEIDCVAARYVVPNEDAGRFFVARDELATYDSATLCVLWPAIAARAGVTLDRRGTLRLAQFTISGVHGARIQLSGCIEVYRHRSASGDGFVFRRVRSGPVTPTPVRLEGVVEFGSWRFRPASRLHDLAETAGRSIETPDHTGCVSMENAWSAELPADCQLMVREWRPGDRMRPGAMYPARRVKRFFGDARIPTPSRAGWPVVLADNEIVWIPGIRRTHAASERSGRPRVRYVCERFDGGRAYS